MVLGGCAPVRGGSVTDIHVVTNDNPYHDEGIGTYASRSTVFVGSAVHDGALRLKQELQAVVARSVGCDPAEVEIGPAGATGPDRTMSWSELGPRRVIGRHEAPEPTFGFGFHLAVVRADPDTGLVIPEKIAVAYDCGRRSEEHTSELQSLMRISYAVFCLKNKNQTQQSDTRMCL